MADTGDVSARTKVWNNWSDSLVPMVNVLPVVAIEDQPKKKTVSQTIRSSETSVEQIVVDIVGVDVGLVKHEKMEIDSQTTENSKQNVSKTKVKRETRIKAQKAVKKSRIIQAKMGVSNRVRSGTLKKALQMTFTKPSVKPEAYKNAFQTFVTEKFTVKDNVPFLQDRSCCNCPKGVSLCLECFDSQRQAGESAPKRVVDSQMCRFYHYRTLIKRDGVLSVYAFAEQGNATAEDTKVWLPWVRPQLSDETAKFLLQFVSEQFCNIYREEFNAIGDNKVTWKKPVKGVRELCDVCQTTIFNTHWVCPACGYAVCIDCYRLRRDNKMAGQPKKHQDEYGWMLCNDRVRHELSKFHLALFITKAVFASLNTSLHIIRNRLKIEGKCECGRVDRSLIMDLGAKIPDALELRDRFSHVPHQWYCDNRLLVLSDPQCAQNVDLFQIHWLRGHPVMVQNVHKRLDQTLWTPDSFSRDFGKQSSRLVNCMNGVVVPKRPMKDFWDGFENVNQRIVDPDTGQQTLLKLKDWPPNAEFRDKLPKRFNNLMDSLPLPEYTRFDGPKNLSTRLPEFFVRPDLGPKMYCAYGSVMFPDKGTTNLHLDMSDAINVMIYVGIARQEGKPIEDHCQEAIESLRNGGCDEQMIARVRECERKVGALWHIFPARDANKIRVFLSNLARERNERIAINNDPIHDQCWYLDEPLRRRLFGEYGVRGFAIAQCLGDAILIPAGAPHQVRNLHSCIKVAGEFVSPENVAHCVSLTHEFRKLSSRHNNHEDKLQIKNIIYHTVKDAMACLHHHF